MSEFAGFPGIGRATALPNLFFSAVLPRLESPGALVAFLWVCRLAQEPGASQKCASAAEIWSHPAARESFEALGGGREGLEAGLAECLGLGALVAVELRGGGAAEVVYFQNDPVSRRTVERARAGELKLRKDSTALAIEAPERRPGIFTLYEEHIGTLTPLMAERLAEAEELYPLELIAAAFREAAERNIRNWRYIEAMLKNWKREGREDEAASPDSLESRKQRYLGGDWGHIVNTPR